MSNITIEWIQSFVEHLGSDSLKVVGGKFEGGIHLQQVPDEIAPCIYDLLELQKRNDVPGIKSYLEIGTAAGGTTYLFNYFFDLERIVVIDDNKHPKFYLRAEILNGIARYECIGDSHSEEIVDKVKGLEETYDLLLIDGDHSYEGVKKDMDLYCELVNYQGFILFHDTVACPGIREYMVDIRNDSQFNIKYINTYVSKTHPKPCDITLFQNFRRRARKSE